LLAFGLRVYVGSARNVKKESISSPFDAAKWSGDPFIFDLSHHESSEEILFCIDLHAFRNE
jgi:hypothetical protein